MNHKVTFLDASRAMARLYELRQHCMDVDQSAQVERDGAHVLL